MVDILLFLAGHVMFSKSLIGLMHVYSSGSVFVAVAANMVLVINDNHIVFIHMDTYHSCMLRHSHFASTDYLVIEACIRHVVLFPSFISLTSTNICVYVKIFPGMVGYRA